MQFTTTLFCQIVHLVPRLMFGNLVRKDGAERHAKRFSSWEQFVSVIFCQIAQAKSLAGDQ